MNYWQGRVSHTIRDKKQGWGRGGEFGSEFGAIQTEYYSRETLLKGGRNTKPGGSFIENSLYYLK